MTEEEQRIVRESVEAWNLGDVDAVLRHLDPEVELIPIRSLLEGGAYHGHDGMRRFAADMADEWEGIHMVIDELREAGDDVLVLGRFQARGRASGVEIDEPAAWLTAVRDGRVTRMQAFSTRDEALRVTGVEA